MTATRWKAFDGTDGQVRNVRRWLETLLAPGPARDDLVLVATELSTNAVRHTASGRGGRFTVEIVQLDSVVRLTVADGGAPTEPLPASDPLAEHGRGLFVVQALAERTGVTGDCHGREVWAELPWPGDLRSQAS
jgi:anti-sigma regulatory factor (Ser/Thr protein kinase)